MAKESLRNKRFTIGVLFDFFCEEFQAKIWNGIVDAARDIDVNLVCYLGGPLNSPEVHHQPRNSVYSLIDQANADGLILMSATIGNFIDTKRLKNFYDKFKPIPMLSIGVPFKDIPSIIVDNTAGFYKTIEHIILVHGCKKIAFIGGMEGNPEAEQRYDIYKEVLAKHNIPINSDLITRGNFYFGSGADAITTLLEERKIYFDAVVASNDIMAIDAVKELQKRDISVPYDVIVTGFDDIEDARINKPALTTVSQPLFEMGYKSVEIMDCMLNNKKIEQVTVLKSKMVVRRSCGCFSFNNEQPLFISRIKQDQENITDYLEEECLYKILDIIKEKSAVFKENEKSIDWIKQLLFALYEDIQGISKMKFLSTLDTILKRAKKAGFDVLYWRVIISIILSNITLYLTNKDEISYINSLWNYAQEIIWESEEEFQSTSRVKTKEKTRELHVLSIELITTFNFKKLEEVIVKGLPRLGINRCYLNEYIGADENKELLSKNLIYYDNDFVLNDTYLQNKFRAKDFFAEYKNRSEKRYSIIVMALYFKNENLGFAVFEEAPLEGIIYEDLTIQISGALKGAKLLDQVTKHANELEIKVKQRTMELENANQQKTRFFINLAHETKTPLTLIKNYLDKYIKKRGFDYDLNIIKNNIDKLLRDMVNFLDVEKLKKGQIFYNNDQITDLTEILERKIILFREIANDKNIKINSTIENDLYIKVDPYAIDRIINNLLDNSIKYTNNGGIIFVSLKVLKDQVILVITDDGIGMDNEQLKNIFKPYYQMSNKKRNVQGIGMGLSIVKMILDSIDAEIDVKSEIDKGTTFIIKFIKYNLSGEDEIIKDIKYSTPMSLKIMDYNIQPENIDAEKSNIFIVDDNKEMLIFLQEYLKDKYNVFLAENGKKALQEINNIPTPDLIISDIMMDEINGHQFFIEISKFDKYRSIPFIFLTAKSSYEDKLRGLTEGAVDYIYKPFMIEELIAKINSIIKNKKIQNETNLKVLEKNILSAFDEIDNNENFYNPDDKCYEKICSEYDITNRELEIINLLINGLYNKDISKKLDISIRTVEFHIHNIYKKLNVQSRIELIKLLKS